MQLRPYQLESVRRTLEFLTSGEDGNPLCVLPTGAGKSVVIAKVISSLVGRYPNYRILLLSHRAELIEQNYDKLLQVDTRAQFYAGVCRDKVKGARDTQSQVVFSTMQTAWAEIKKSRKRQATLPDEFKDFGVRNLIIVDECHLISTKNNTTYQQIFGIMANRCKGFKVFGLTATHYRLGQGLLTQGEGALFTDIVHDMSSQSNLHKMIKAGYLAPLRSMPPSGSSIDLSNIAIQRGEFSSADMSKEADRIMLSAIQETIAAFVSSQRKACMVFVSSIENCEKAKDILLTMGARADCVHSKRKASDNTEIIEAFKRGELDYLVNNGKLTTGFDYPALDMISMIRATTSPALWLQIMGRATRPARGKEYGLILDFGSNIERLGGFDTLRPPKPPGQSKGETGPPIKHCPNCNMHNFASARVCEFCEHEFKFEVKYMANYGNAEVLSCEAYPRVDTLAVRDIAVTKYKHASSPAMLRIAYKTQCGREVTEKYDIEKERAEFEKWFCTHVVSCSFAAIPSNVDHVTVGIHTGNIKLRIPRTISVREGETPTITNVGF